MPTRTTTEFVDAAQYLEYKGVQIYHTYEDDDVSNGYLDYWYVLREDADLNEAFDVRDLAAWDAAKDAVRCDPRYRGKNVAAVALMLAIDSGELISDGARQVESNTGDMPV